MRLILISNCTSKRWCVYCMHVCVCIKCVNVRILSITDLALAIIGFFASAFKQAFASDTLDLNQRNSEGCFGVGLFFLITGKYNAAEFEDFCEFSSE